MREEELSFLPFWDKLKKNQREILCKHTKSLALSKGERILSCNLDYGCFYIKKGAFLALLFGETDTETELFRLRREETAVLDFSEICGQEVTDIAYCATADADIVLIEKIAFSTLNGSNVFFSEYVNKGLLTRIPLLISAIGQRDHFSLEKRVITVLLSESARQRSNTLSLTHAGIASKIGSAREVITRKMREFSEAELVTCTRGKIILTNKEKLRKRLNP